MAKQSAEMVGLQGKYPGVTVEELHWGCIYCGDEVSLVNAGLVKAEWLPGKPDNPKVSLRVALVNGTMQVLPTRCVATREQEENLLSIARRNKTKYEVWKRFPAEEIDRRKRREKIEKLHEDKAKRIAEFPADHEAFRKRQLHYVGAILEALRRSFVEADGGYSFGQDLVIDFDIMAEQLLEMINDGRVYFSQEKRREAIARIESKALADYPRFASFMTTTLAVAKAAG